MTRVPEFFKPLLTATALVGFAAATPFAAAQEVQAEIAATAADAVDLPAATEAAAASKIIAEAAPKIEAAPEIASEIASETSPEIAPDVETEIATPVVDYSIMTRFMERLSVNERGRPAIAYQTIREQGLPILDEYESQLVAVDVDSLDGDDRLAHWLNLQNVLVVKAIATDTKKTNLKSLRGTGKKPGKLWTKDRIEMKGQGYSIADIEAKIVSEFDDPNVIYGLYQGVKGGPCISETAYDGATVKTRLAELGMRYVNSRGIVSPSKGVVTVTPVYDWYKADLFENDNKAILKHVKVHANTALRGRLNTGREIEFTKLNYVADNHVVGKGAKSRSKGKGKRRPQQGRSNRPEQRPSGGSGGGGFGS